MKIQEILEAKTIDPKLEQYADLIIQNCMPYLSQSKGAALYRGTRSQESQFVEKTVRTSRKPVGSKKEWQQRFDEIFTQLGFPVKRSNCVFAAGIGFNFEDYLGFEHDLYVMIPIGNFEVVWSPKVEDLYVYLTDLLYTSGTDDPKIDSVESFINSEDFVKFVKKNYKVGNIRSAIKSRNEIMIKCEKYYLIDEYIWPSIKRLIAKKLKAQQ